MKNFGTMKLSTRFKEAPFVHTRLTKKDTVYFASTAMADSHCTICGLDAQTIAEQKRKGETDPWCKSELGIL